MRALHAAVGHLHADALLCQGGRRGLTQRFRAACKRVDLEQAPLSLGSIRGGGATHHFTQCQNLCALQFRGRWESNRTLAHYLQQGLASLAYARLAPNTIGLLHSLSHLLEGVLEATLNFSFHEQ